MGGACQQLAVDGHGPPSLRDANVLRNGAVGGGYGFQQQGEDDLRRSNRPDGLLSGPTTPAGPGPGPQHDDMENHQQQQVCWERFLQKKTINVLLVESDDSTRQVVSALLRHCMYQGSSFVHQAGQPLLHASLSVFFT